MAAVLGQAVLTGTPRGECTEHGGELSSRRRQLIRQPSRPFLVRGRRQQALLLEVSEAGGQHVGGDPGDVSRQFTIATRPTEERPNDKERPAVAHLIEGQGKGSIGHPIIVSETELPLLTCK